jgi:hypothetical protein
VSYVSHELHAATLGGFERAGHGIERLGKIADLVLSAFGHALGVVASGDATGGRREPSDRPRDPTRDGQTHDDRRKDCDERSSQQSIPDGVHERGAGCVAHRLAHRVARPMPHRLGEVARTDKAHGESHRAERRARDDEIGD